MTRQRFAVLLLLALAGCRGKHQRVAVQNEEPPEGGPRIASAFKMNDAYAQEQLLHGFYGVEGGAWRWTAGKFTVLLRPPLTSAQHGATLTLAFSIPDVVLPKLHELTLTASVGSTKLKSETYTKPGNYSFSADVAPELLEKEAFIVDFGLDKNVPPGPVDKRELGVIALAVGLQGK